MKYLSQAAMLAAVALAFASAYAADQVMRKSEEMASKYIDHLESVVNENYQLKVDNFRLKLRVKMQGEEILSAAQRKGEE